MMGAAYTWVCTSRLESGHNNSIWDLRYNWTTIKPLLQKQLRDGHYFLSAIQSHCKGFDFLGVHFGALPTIAKASLEKHRAKLAQRYAQGASPACIGDYVTRWTSWCRSVLRASGDTNNNKTNLLERWRPHYQWSVGSNSEENSDEKNAYTGASGDWIYD